MKSYELYDLQFLLREVGLFAHSIKKDKPDHAKMLFDKLDRVEPIIKAMEAE